MPALVGAGGVRETGALSISRGRLFLLFRLRVAQALATNPSLLLCDEPLLSLDLNHQQMVVDMIDRRRREHDTAVLFVTHEINPVLPIVDLVLYIINGAFRLGTPDDVLRSDVLSQLYAADIEVIRRDDRIVVLGASSVFTDHHHIGDGHTDHHRTGHHRTRR